MIAGPSIKPGTHCDRLVCNLDLAPTLLEFAGVAVPKVYQGLSLRPLLTDPKVAFRAGFLYEGTGGYGDVPPMAAWITERTKIIHTLGVMPVSAPSFIECYDLQKDADETKNLSSSPELSTSRDEAVAAFKQHDWKQDRTPAKGRTRELTE